MRKWQSNFVYFQFMSGEIELQTIATFASTNSYLLIFIFIFQSIKQAKEEGFCQPLVIQRIMC